ncbi:MAG: isoprenylcysteine carboxylmethyltransferase family protein [Hyphomonadaceae bacterium]
MRSIPPPLWMLLLIAATYALAQFTPLQDLPVLRHQPAAALVTALALTMLIAAIVQFRRADTQLLPNSPENNALVTGGVFNLTRNPMYLGMTLICLAAALWYGHSIMLATPVLMFAVANWAFIPFEEAKMRRQFGEAFDAYTKRVRRWI